MSAFHISFEDGHIPNRVKVWRIGIVMLRGVAAKVFDRHAIAAEVVIFGSMQGHVEVAHKMNDEAQCVCAFNGGLSGVFQNCELFGNRSNNTAAISAEFGQRQMRRAARDAAM